MDDNTSFSQEMEEIEMVNLEFLTRVDTCCDNLYCLYFYQGKEFSRSYVDNSIQPLLRRISLDQFRFRLLSNTNTRQRVDRRYKRSNLFHPRNPLPHALKLIHQNPRLLRCQI